MQQPIFLGYHTFVRFGALSTSRSVPVSDSVSFPSRFLFRIAFRFPFRFSFRIPFHFPSRFLFRIPFCFPFRFSFRIPFHFPFRFLFRIPFRFPSHFHSVSHIGFRSTILDSRPTPFLVPVPDSVSASPPLRQRLSLLFALLPRGVALYRKQRLITDSHSVRPRGVRSCGSRPHLVTLCCVSG